MPERNDQDRQRFENLEPRPSDEYTATGGIWAWWWVWFIILACAFIWFAGWGWGSRGGWLWGNRQPTAQRNAGGVNGPTYNGPVGTPVPPANSGPAGAPANGSASTAGTAGAAGANAPALTASNKREFEGKALEASGVPVLKKVTNHVFWVGPNNSAAPLLVVVSASGNALAANLQTGETVNVSGTVEKAPPAAKAEKNWGLDNTEAARLQQEGAYLNATQANPAQP